MLETRIIVCGGRRFGLINSFNDPDDVKRAEAELSLFYATMREYVPKHALIIDGAATGADDLAFRWARLNERNSLRFHAKWNEDGKSAGPRRNVRMLEEGQPHFVIAFPGGKGTAHMVKIAKAAGVPVHEIGMPQITEHFQ